MFSKQFYQLKTKKWYSEISAKRMPPVIKPKSVLIKETKCLPLFKELQGTSTPFGFTLDQALVRTPGRVNGNIIDFIAGDVHCYKIFCKVYEPVYIARALKEERHPFCFDYTKLEMPFGHEPEIVKSMQFAVSRSIKEHRFMSVSNVSEKVDLEKGLLKSFSFLPEKYQGCYFSLKKRMFGGLMGLFESRIYGDMNRLYKFLCGLLWVKTVIAAKSVSKDKQNSASLCNITPEELSKVPCTDLNIGAGINRDWPDGRGIYVSEDKTLCIAVNRDCHLKIYLKCETNDTLDSFKSLCAVYRGIQRGLQRENLHFAYDDKFGFVNWNPNKIGSNLELSAKVDLPLLQNHEMFRIFLSVNGLQGKFLNDEDDSVEIFHQASYGEAETEMVRAMTFGLRMLTRFENRLDAGVFSDLDIPSRFFIERAAPYLDDIIIT